MSVGRYSLIGRAPNCGFGGYRFDSYYLPKIQFIFNLSKNNLISVSDKNIAIGFILFNMVIETKKKFHKPFCVSLNKWFTLYYNFVLLKCFSINFRLFVFLSRSMTSPKFTSEPFYKIDLYFAIILKTLQLKINYIDMKELKRNTRFLINKKK